MTRVTAHEVRMLVARSSVADHHVPLSLPKTNLEMIDLPHVDLRGADLAGANLRGAMLFGATLEGACLDRADLTCADLTWADLSRCSTEGTILVEANMNETTVGALSNANTAGADLVTVTFADLREILATMENRGEPIERTDEMVREHEAAKQETLRVHRATAASALRARGARGFQLSRYTDREAYLRDTFEHALVRELSDKDLGELLRWSAETCKPLNLRGCNLSRAKLRRANLDGVCLCYGNLEGADLRKASLGGACLRHANLTDTRLRGARLDRADLLHCEGLSG